MYGSQTAKLRNCLSAPSLQNCLMPQHESPNLIFLLAGRGAVLGGGISAIDSVLADALLGVAVGGFSVVLADAVLAVPISPALSRLQAPALRFKSTIVPCGNHASVQLRMSIVPKSCQQSSSA